MNLACVSKLRSGPLFQYRSKYNLNQRQAAELCGIPYTTWNALECMRFNTVSYKTITRIAVVLNVQPEDICPPELQQTNFKAQNVQFRDLTPMQIEAALQRQLPYTPLTTDAPELIDRALFRLPYREREFVKLRFGLNGPEHSLQQISEIWKITTARVRQVLNNAIRKLQHPTTARLLENAFKSQPFEQERLLP